MLYSNAVIDWLSVVMNGFWILGTAVLLASFSYQYSQTAPRSLKERLEEKAFLRPFWVGMTLISIGLAGTSQTGWETGLWSLFIIMSLMIFIKQK